MSSSSNFSVLVFGDSWGQLGPSWKALQDMFDAHGVAATVKSSAVGGTRACDWADTPSSLADKARDLFGADGPQYVWYTAGGNDLEAKWYETCSATASTYDEAVNGCLRNATTAINACTETLLTKLWAAFPRTKVVQCGYDLPCEDGSHCLEVAMSRTPFCRANRTCQNAGLVDWQPMLLELAAKHPLYTGLNVLGAVQAAGGVAGAAVGAPVLARGSPCGLMTYCVHPTYGAAGATAVAEAFWSLYFEDEVRRRREASAAPPPMDGAPTAAARATL